MADLPDKSARYVLWEPEAGDRLRPPGKRTSISGGWMSVHSQEEKSVLPQEVEHWSLTT